VGSIPTDDRRRFVLRDDRRQKKQGREAFLFCLPLFFIYFLVYDVNMALLSWSTKRQLFYITILVLFFSTFAFIIAYPTLKKEPTCFDGKQNGLETGVDCGGGCALACINELEPMSVLWSRAFRVIGGRYNAVAYVVNHNPNEAIQKISYRFRFADANNIYIGKREGSTFIPPGGSFAIFEPAIDVGNSIPVYVNFEFTEVPVWYQISKEKVDQLKVLVSDINLIDATTSPKLTATVRNPSLFTLPDVGFITILNDANGNALSTSRTYINELKPLEIRDINFTWPEPIPGEVVEKEIIPMFDFFQAKLE
jgi:hypothetical protein